MLSKCAQAELNELLTHYPMAAERLIKAIDKDRIDMGVYSRCVYGAVHRGWGATAKANPVRLRHIKAYGYSHLEFCDDQPQSVFFANLRDACVVWLAEHGTAKEPSLVSKMKARVVSLFLPLVTL